PIRVNLQRRWRVMAGVFAGIGGGIAYHALNSHVLMEQLRRSKEFEIDIVEAGKTRVLFQRYIDPKQNSAHRKWFDFDLPLGAGGASPIDVHFVTRPGPKGDIGYDHAGWSNPLLTQ